MATQGKIATLGARSSGLRAHRCLSGRWSAAQEPSGTRSPLGRTGLGARGEPGRAGTNTQGVPGSESSAHRIQHRGLGRWVARAPARAGGEVGPEGEGRWLLSFSSCPQAQGNSQARPSPGAPISGGRAFGGRGLPPSLGSWLFSVVTPVQNSLPVLRGPGSGPGIQE